MNAWLPQASYPCGNFSVTSSQIFSGLKGSIGHTFVVLTVTENQNQASFSPFGLQEISVLLELTLGHLRCNLADVPPQPNSPPDFVPDGFRQTQGLLLIPHSNTVITYRVSRATLKVVVFHCRRSSHVFYTFQATSQSQTRVKLNRVFFPRLCCQARSLGCEFAR